MEKQTQLDYKIIFEAIEELKKESDYDAAVDCCIESEEIKTLKNIVDEINEPTFFSQYSV